MTTWFETLDPVAQALLAGVFRWGVTAIRAALVFFTRTVNRALHIGAKMSEADFNPYFAFRSRSRLNNAFSKAYNRRRPKNEAALGGKQAASFVKFG